jgi:uncharacterized membrane-anchored protein
MHPRFTVAQLEEHPLRQRLDAEFHARPPIPLEGPVLVSHLVFKHRRDTVERERENLARITQSTVCHAIESSDAHLFVDAGSYRLHWELHTEFSSYTFFRPLVAGADLTPDATAFDATHPEWMGAIPGRLVAATHVELRAKGETSPEAQLAKMASLGRQIVSSKVGDGRAWVFTDFKLDNGFSRFILLDEGMTQRQAGRMVQRLVEIESYRMMALLGLPVAKDVGGWLHGAEKELAELMDRIGRAATPEDERAVLSGISELAAKVEHSVARTTFRFGASAAYQGMVSHRIEELREARLPGLPTIAEFMQRRLLPAMATCAAISRRQEDLSARIARSSQLLRARVEIDIEQQNQELFAQMNHRAKLQLRLQETVEGLSVVVLTYYGSQLVQYLAKGTKELHHASTDVITAASIPIIAALVAWGTHRLRKRLASEPPERH